MDPLGVTGGKKDLCGLDSTVLHMPLCHTDSCIDLWTQYPILNSLASLRQIGQLFTSLPQIKVTSHFFSPALQL